MVRNQIYLEERQEARLKRVARGRGISEAEVIRQAIDRQVIRAGVQSRLTGDGRTKVPPHDRLPASVVVSGLSRTRAFRQAEVQQLRSRLRHHHIGRLEVAMGDPFAMSLVERVRDLDRVAERLVE